MTPPNLGVLHRAHDVSRATQTIFLRSPFRGGAPGRSLKVYLITLPVTPA